MMTTQKIMNDPFPLSEKYKYFLKYNASAEFLEGTTSAGKTTVAVPKFFFKVASYEGTKPSIIAGLDLGTIEKNIINADHGLYDVFGDYENGNGRIEYSPTGKGKIRLPHILFHTHNGVKIIYVLGYDNKKRWKKALGGQYYGLFIDEFNIADMDFVREAFMRADYRLCTLNPDDPNKECFSQYVNKARPCDKYKNDAPDMLLKMLNEPKKEDWTWWYFTFRDNASLTQEKLHKIIDSVPVGTKLYKNKILGLRGKATGLVFNLEPKDIITEIDAKKNFKFVRFSIGCDTSYSRVSHDQLTFEGIGITEDGKCILLEEEVHNNANVSSPFAPSDVIPKLVDFAEMFKIKWGLAKTIYIDSADAGTIEEAKKYKRSTNCIYDFVGAWKKTTNITRVQLEQSWLKTNNFLICDTCNNYINECNAYSYTEDGELEDANDHSIQGCQYAWLPFKSQIGDWSIIKTLIKDADKY